MLSHVVLSVVALFAAGVAAAPEALQRDVVDLGYTLHKGTLNKTRDTYAFNNIRFADPPLGKLRFQPPVPVSKINRRINDGSHDVKCPQGYPEWTLPSMAAMAKLPSATVLRKQLEADRTQSEDCLFLNVVVPRKTYDAVADARGAKPSSRAKGENGVPVMVWIYGGGFTNGAKDQAYYDPSGLLRRASEEGGEGAIYVALNYRLGIYGFLNTVHDAALHPNIGLLDQRLGLQWVSRYIHLFGGDPKRITVFGESAGGSSIMFHLTAEGGRLRAPFSRAIVQSPGAQTVIDVAAVLKRTLSTASAISRRRIRNGADLARLDGATLFKINNKVVADSAPGTFTFGPTVDGGYVPDLPGVLLKQGRFDPHPDLMLGHNADEGSIFLPDPSNDPSRLRRTISSFFPGIPSRNLAYIWNKLYPAPSSSPGRVTAYKTQRARASQLVSEAIFTCNTRFLATAFHNRTYNYRFQQPPATHGQDVLYTYHRNGDHLPNGQLANAMQLYFTSFAQTGRPGRPSLPRWPAYGAGAAITTFGPKGVGRAMDDTKNKRCDYWQTGRYRH